MLNCSSLLFLDGEDRDVEKTEMCDLEIILDNPGSLCVDPYLEAWGSC